MDYVNFNTSHYPLAQQSVLPHILPFAPHNFAFDPIGAYSNKSEVPISLSAKSQSRRRMHPYVRPQKDLPLVDPMISQNNFDVHSGSVHLGPETGPSANISADVNYFPNAGSGTQQHDVTWDAHNSLSNDYVPTSADKFQLSSMTYMGNHGSIFNSLEGHNAQSEQSYQHCDQARDTFNFVGTNEQDPCAPFLSQHLYPHSMNHPLDANLYQQNSLYSSQTHNEPPPPMIPDSFIDPTLFALPDLPLERELPPYSAYNSGNPVFFPAQPESVTSVPTVEKPLKDSDKVYKAPIEFIIENPQTTRLKVKKPRATGKKRIGVRAAAKVESGQNTDNRRPTRASWLEKAYVWKRNESFSKSNGFGARYLVETREAEEPRMHETSDWVTVKEVDLPLLPCPVAGCNMTCRGIKKLQTHLKDSVDLILNPGHGFVINNSKNQQKMHCVASSQCSAEIARGAMIRHLIEYHSNVWLYCTMCDLRMTRENQMQRHFKNKHQGGEVSKQFREIVHQKFDEASDLIRTTTQ